MKHHTVLVETERADRRRAWTILPALVACAALTACGGGGGGTSQPPPPPPPPANVAPTIGGTPDTSVDEDQSYAFTPTAADVDGDVLTFSVQNPPPWASFDTATGALTGTPVEGEAGVYANIVITVSDGTADAALPAFAIEVVAVNDAPVIAGTPPTTVDEFQPYAFTPTASDPEGSVLEFTAQNLPAWASLDPATGALTGTPGEADDGVYAGIVLTVSDGALSSSLPPFDIEVLEVNTAPQISGTPATSVDEGDFYAFTPDATDADAADTLTFSIENAPPWATFEPDTGALFGTPADGDAGNYPDIVITVSDGLESTSLAAFEITVVEITNLMVSGKVTDAPIANAEVTLTAGAQVVTATADAQGDYSLLLALRDGDFDGETLVRLTARGAAGQEQVELVSVLGSIAQLVAAGGDDEGLAAAQYPRLNVTHVTTARYLLAADGNGGADPADAAALAAAETAIPPDLLLSVASLIKLIVDDGLIDVPAGETVLSLLQSDSPGVTNRSTIDALLLAEGLIDADGEATPAYDAALAAARAATLADGDVSAAPQAAALAGTSVWGPAAPPGILPREPTTKAVVDLAADGTGVFYEPAFVASGLVGSRLQVTPLALSWALAGNGLTLTFDAANPKTRIAAAIAAPFGELVDTFGFDQAVADFLVQAQTDGAVIPSPLPIDQRFASRAVNFVSTVDEQYHTVFTDTLEYDLDEVLQALGWPGELPRGSASVDGTRVVTAGTPAVTPLTDDVISRQSWALPVFYAQGSSGPGLALDVFNLTVDGVTTPGRLSGLVFDWSFEGDALVLSSGDERYSFTRRRERVGQVDFVVATYSVSGVVQARYTEGVARQVVSEATALFTDLPSQVLPAYWSTVAGTEADRSDAYLADGRLDPEQVLGWVFTDAVTAARFLGEDPTCLTDDSRGCFNADNTTWSWSAGGTRVSLARTIPPNNDTREREWEVLRYDPATGTAVVLELELLRLAAQGVRDVLVPGRLNLLRLDDLSVYPAEYQDALNSGFPFN